MTKEERREYSRRYWERHKEEIRKKQRERYRNDPEKYRQAAREYRAREGAKMRKTQMKSGIERRKEKTDEVPFEKKDPLSRDAWLARELGMTYGKFKAMQYEKRKAARDAATSQSGNDKMNTAIIAD